ncbi:MAG: iron-sulfur cluster assembly accessory protein [Pseudomonadota bacterium]
MTMKSTEKNTLKQSKQGPAQSIHRTMMQDKLTDSKPQKAILNLSEKAKERIRFLMTRAPEENIENIIALRVALSTKGCSGMSYVVEYAYDKKPHEEVIKEDDVCIFIDPAAIMFLIGTTMDYREGSFSSGFVFDNPNEKSRCGCGESFMV